MINRLFLVVLLRELITMKDNSVKECLKVKVLTSGQTEQPMNDNGKRE